MIPANPWLAAGGLASAVAAAAHLACIAGGPAWYRTMGAPEGFAIAASRGSWTPALITMAIAAMLALFAAYAWSGAGLIARLPLLRVGLLAITALYLARGAVLVAPSLLRRPDLSPGFILWSSGIVLAMGLVHAIGVARAWKNL